MISEAFENKTIFSIRTLQEPRRDSIENVKNFHYKVVDDCKDFYKEI